MWSEEQLNAAKYVVYKDYESKQDLNVGTVEISGTNTGIYLIVPAPPFGGLGSESSSVPGLKFGCTVPSNAMSIEYRTRSWPVADRYQPDQYILHDYGKCWL